MWKLLAATLASSLILFAACAEGGDSVPTATLSEEEQSIAATVAAVETIAADPLPTPLMYDIAAIDLAISAIRSGEPEAVLAQLRTTSIVCMLDVSGFRPPPSCEGATTEMLDDVFPVGNCDFRYVPRAEAVRHLSLWLEAGTGPEVVGVYHVQRSAFSDLYRTHDRPQFAIVLRTALSERVAGWVLIYNQDGLIGFGTGCFRTPEEVLEVWQFEGSVIPESQITPTLTPTPLPTPPLTGIAAVDVAIDAIQRQDGDALVAQMRMTRIACEATPMGKSPYPLCDGAPEATLVDGFPISSCSGRYAEREVAVPLIRSLVTAPTAEVFAVYETAGTRFEESFYSYARPTHVVVIQRLSGDYRNGSGILVDEEGIVGQVGGCTARPEGFIEFWELNDAVVIEPSEFLPTPTPEDIGIPTVDSVIDAVLEEDVSALLAQVSYLNLPCSLNSPNRTLAPNCEGAQKGTLVEAFPIRTCSRYFVTDSEVEDWFMFQGGILFGRELYAVFPTAGSKFQEEFFSIAGSMYVVLLESVSNNVGLGSALLVNDQGLVGYTTMCGMPLEDYILGQELTDPIIPPPQDR